VGEEFGPGDLDPVEAGFLAGEKVEALFSLLGQSYRSLNIILAPQRFSAAEVAATREALAPMLDLSGAPKLTVRNLEQPTPKDARALLLNLGLPAVEYVGFLDYDDVLYPEAYSILISRLRTTEAASAFAAVRGVTADMYPQFIRVASKSPFGAGNCLSDLFRGISAPSTASSWTGTRSTRRTCRSTRRWFGRRITISSWGSAPKYPSDFGLIKTKIGEYYFKTDDSNSIPWNGVRTEAQEKAYEMVAAAIETRRRTTVVSARVQSENGMVPPQTGVTIRGFLDRLGRG
jgi:hypothetical protein